jgi:hypothetical protein
VAKTLAFDFVKSFIEQEGYSLLENSYKNSISQMTLECPVGHVFPMSWKVFSKGHRCSYCAGKRQYTTEEVAKILKEEFNYTLLSDTYSSNKQKLLVRGPDGVEYETTFFAIKVNKILPHNKGMLKSEEECRAIFEKITNKTFPHSKPSWLVNPETGKHMELDGYCQELKLAFEFDGRYHFKNKNKDDTEKNFYRDRIKDRLCKKNGIRLIRIPHYIVDKNRFIENEIFRPGNFLYIGDPHVQPDSISEYKKIFEWVAEEAKKSGTNNIVLLGDLFHNHNVIRMEVGHFWRSVFQKLLKQFRLHVLIGNHDMILGSHENSEMSALDSLKSKYTYTLNIADAPYSYGPLGFMSYQQDQELFKKHVNFFNSMGIKTIVCHQDFDGAQYENGFYSPHGIKLEDVNAELIISGHIHKRQRFGKLILPGTPRWMTSSDANEDKGIWLVTHDMDTGSILSERFLPTSDILEPLVSIEIAEGEDISKIKMGNKTHIKLVGSSAWIAKTAKALRGKARVSAKPTDTRFSGEPKQLSSLESYAVQFKFEDASKEEVLDYIRSIQ